MSFLLTSESGVQTGWTHFAWPIVCRLAQDFGWQPHGTRPPANWDPKLETIGEWDGRYTSNDGQLVTAQDALALGRGLSAALTSDQFEDRIRQLIGGVTGQLHSPGFAVMLDNELSEWRKSIEAFAAFCGKGGFRLR